MQAKQEEKGSEEITKTREKRTTEIRKGNKENTRIAEKRNETRE